MRKLLITPTARKTITSTTGIPALTKYFQINAMRFSRIFLAEIIDY